MAGPVSVFLTRVSAVMAAVGPGDTQAPPWLSNEERARYLAIAAARRRTQFVAGRWWARQCLAVASGGPWHEHVLSAPDDAAPQVLEAPNQIPGRPLHFSLSHSADWLACAVADHPIGIDVEDLTRSRDTDALGNWIYGPAEHALIEATPLALRKGRFFELWCLKEAWIKQRRAPGIASMSSAQFLPCAGHADDDDQALQALVLNAPTWMMAVLPARSCALRLHGAELAEVPVRAWRLASNDDDDDDDENIRA